MRLQIYRNLVLKWIEVYDLSERNYNVNKEVRVKKPMLRSNLCDYSDVYIVVTGNITLTGESNKSRRKRPLAFKNNSPFIGCVLKIDNVLIDNAEDLDVVMPIYNFLEYSKITKKQQVVCGIITEMN